MKLLLTRKTISAPGRWRALAATALAAGASLFAQRSSAEPVLGLQHVHYAIPAAAASTSALGKVPDKLNMNFSIGLSLRDPAGLDAFIADVSNPKSPNYRHYLSAQQFADRFGPTETDYQKVVSFAQSHGFTVTSTHENRLVIGLRGSALAVQKALHTTIGVYKDPKTGRIFHSPTVDPSLDLPVSVASFGGLDDYAPPHPNLRPKTTGSGNTSGGVSVKDTTTSGVKTTVNTPATPQAGSGPSGAYLAKDFRAAYCPGVTQTGAGESLGLLEFETSWYPADITAFDSATGAPNIPVIGVSVDGWNTNNTGSADANSECSLDIEMAIGMAPGLTSVLVYEGESGDDILSAMASGPCKALSASWTYTTDATTETLFKEFAAQGQTYCNASGDSDAYVGAPPTPCDDTNVLCVGGTTLSTSGAGGSWTSEVVWNDGLVSGSYQGTGGGVSTTVPIPVWQLGLNMTANGGSTTFRNDPDVAACADNVYVYYGNGSAGAFVGTSCATPVWAAFIAMADQLAAANGEPPVGLCNPALYNMGKGLNAIPYSGLFHDITSGNNEWPSSSTKYVATTGYDLCTGWGSPSGSNLLYQLALPEGLRVSAPALNYTGPVGGPFTPSSLSVSLTNFSPSSINWTITGVPAWLDVSATNGTVVPGGAAATVTVSIDPSVSNTNNYPVATYTANLLFTDLNDGFSQTNVVTLAIVGAPVIVGQPTNVVAVMGTVQTFTVSIAPNPLVSYHWQTNGVNLLTTGSVFSGVTNATLTIPFASSNYIRNYTCVISNVVGSVTSSIATLAISNSAPIFTSVPVSTTNLPGSSAALTVAAVGNTNITYRWYNNGVLLANSTKFTIASTALTGTLTVNNLTATNTGSYYVTASNYLGVVTSPTVTISVTPVTVAGVNLFLNFPCTSSTSSPQYPLSDMVWVPSATAFYGNSVNGGANGYGENYKLTLPATIAREYSYTSSGNLGLFPEGNEILGADGALYGPSTEYAAFGDGDLWRQLPSSTSVARILVFNGTDGSDLSSGVAQTPNGLLYGACPDGGLFNYGCIFRVNTNGSVPAVLMSFDGADGAFPSCTPVVGPDGQLYGSSQAGGPYASGAGNIFKISTNGVLTILHNFNGTNEGSLDFAGVIFGADGNMYGTTLFGGSNNLGTVFQLTPAGVFTTLHTFTGGADGSEPFDYLLQAPDGNLYGTTSAGGTYGEGTVFRVSPTGNFTAIAEFDTYQGGDSVANLALGPDGALYGTCQVGGAAGLGTIFSVTLTNGAPYQISGQPVSQTVAQGGSVAFSVATVGGTATNSTYQWLSNNVPIVNGGSFSGATSYVLTITNVLASYAASYSVVVSNGGTNITSSAATLTVPVLAPVITSQPVSQTAVVGSFVLFSVAVSGDAPSYQWLDNGVTIGGATSSSLSLSNVSLTASGAYSVVISNDAGSVTSSVALLTVSPVVGVAGVTFTNLYLFGNVTNDGFNPEGGVIQGADGALYGTASLNGSNGVGTIFRYALTNSTLANVYSFPISYEYSYQGATTGGNYPAGGLLQWTGGNNAFYGLASGGGTDGAGMVFTMSATARYPVTNLFQFTGVEGAIPLDSLMVSADNKFYATCSQGGSNTVGSVVKMYPASTSTTTNVVLLYSFASVTNNGPLGDTPSAGLIQGTDGNLYGTTTKHGPGGYGTVFQLTTNGVGTALVAFGFTNGATPYGGVIQGADGNLYGTTAEGGAYGDGTVFKVSTTGVFTTLFNFAGTNGDFPAASLLQDAYGNLYGTTEGGGAGGQGTVFMITTNGVLTTLVSFSGYNGSSPESPLIKATDGNLYGTCGLGGTGYGATIGDGDGTVFKVALPVFFTNALTAPVAVAALPYSSSVTAVTPAGDSLTYSLVSGPSWLTITTNGLISGTPANTNIGTNTFVVSVVDATGFGGSTNLTIKVIADPAPTFTTNPVVAASVLLPGSYSGSIAGDATAPYLTNGDSITFALVSGPSWLSVAPNGALSGTPTLAYAGTNTFIISATDLGGASNTVTLLINVTTPPPPVVSVPTNLVEIATNDAGDYVYFSVTATDSTDGTEVPVVTPPSGSLFPIGTTLVTAIATDSVGLSTTNTFTVKVVALPPVLLAPTNITVTATNAAGDIVYFSVSATDTIDGTLTPVVTPPSGSVFPIGTTLVTATATDSVGLSATNTFSVTVVSTPPSITVPTNIIEQATNIAGNVVFFSVTASDAVDGTITPTVTPASGSTFALGTNLVTATATDSLGLSATNTFLVIVEDTNLPVIVDEPVSVTNAVGTAATFTVVATADSPLSYQWSFGTNEITGATNSTLTLPSVALTDAGTYTVAVTSAGGVTNSTPATLTVVAASLVAPTIVAEQYDTNGFTLTFSGPAGQTYKVLGTSDLTVPVASWTVLSTGTFGGTNAVYTDPDSVTNAVEFYDVTSP